MPATQDLPMDLPIVALDVFLTQPRDSPAVAAECAKAANALITYGALVLHDSRVSESDNTTFLDLLEDYFAQPEAALRKDERPELSYQIGVTLENTEKPNAHEPDPKCRFFWSMAEKPPYETRFPGLNAPNVVPDAPHIRDRWPGAMNKWGSSMKAAVTGLAEMAAVGYGPHLLAPTASDLVKYGKQDTILAGFHTDLNFLTIHGRSRYPGLHIWARNTGKKIAVKIPEGNYLLVQAGKQMEHFTGGLIKAGYHEVVVNEKTLAVIERRKKEFPDRPLVRISSTCFWHLSSDVELSPIPQLAGQVRAQQFNLGRDEGEEVRYEQMKVGEQVQQELKHIALMASS
uniref:Clavaminate synthase-like protein n=1 Tax=Colletotrichum fructicola (strain Nara gc5) TaxID=1213859 RepID=L2G0R5_COLFN